MEYPVRNPLTTFLSEDVPQLGHHYLCSIEDMTFSVKQSNEAIRKSFWNENTWRVINIENKGSLSCPASPETEQYFFENHVCGFENHNNQGFMIFSLLAVSYDFVFVFTRNADVVLLAGWGHWAAPLGRNVEHDFLRFITQFSFSRFRYLSWWKVSIVGEKVAGGQIECNNRMRWCI